MNEYNRRFREGIADMWAMHFERLRENGFAEQPYVPDDVTPRNPSPGIRCDEHKAVGISYCNLCEVEAQRERVYQTECDLEAANEECVRLSAEGATKDRLVDVCRSFVEDGFCNDRNCEQAIIAILAELSSVDDGQTTPLTADQVELGRFMGRLGSVDLPPELLADDGQTMFNTCDKQLGIKPTIVGTAANGQCEHQFHPASKSRDYCVKCNKVLTASTEHDERDPAIKIIEIPAEATQGKYVDWSKVPDGNGQDSTFDQDTQTKAKTSNDGISHVSRGDVRDDIDP